MKTQSKYAPPLTVAEYAAYEANIRVLRTMAHRQDCTPLVENSDPAGVALGGDDGQGVCTLPYAVLVDIEAFRLNSEAFEEVDALYMKGLLPVRAVTLLQSALEDRVRLSVTCGYLLFLH